MEEDHDSKSCSSRYDITEEQCIVCYTALIQNNAIYCKCGHNFCLGCMKEYFLTKMDEFDVYPLECPVPNCHKSLYKMCKDFLDKDIYNKLKIYRKNKMCMMDPIKQFCPQVNCDGYGEGSEVNLKCKMCETRFKQIRDPVREEILRNCSATQCPTCCNLVIKPFGCMTVRCLCGTEFCLKCSKSSSDSHKYLNCAASNLEGRFSWWTIIFCIYSIILVPFTPFFIVNIYRANWDKNYFFFMEEHLFFYNILLFIFSPMILVFGFFYFPFIIGWMCVEAMFDGKTGKTKGVFWFLLKIIIYFPSVLLCFLGILLGFALLLIILPLMGLAYLFVRINIQTKY